MWIFNDLVQPGGYYCIIRGMGLREASAVTPFRYNSILFAFLVGAIVFGERLDTATLVGIGLIVSVGIYSL